MKTFKENAFGTKSLLLISLFALSINLHCKKTKRTNPPVLTSLEPSFGIVGDPVTINGSHFENADNVYFNGIPSKIVNYTSSVINTVIPAGMSAGVAKVYVQAEGGKSNELPIEIINTPAHVDLLPPELNRAYPSESYTDYPILIYGNNLSGVIKITFNDKDAVIFTNNQNVITTTVPRNLPDGKVTIKVTTLKGSSTLNFQTLGAPPIPTNANFSLVNIPPPSYVPSISNQWDCGLFSFLSSDANFTYFVDLRSDVDGNGVNYNITGKYKYSYDKTAGYNTNNYIEIINHSEKDTLVGQFSSKFDKPCVLNMVLISSKTKALTSCSFDIRSNDASAACDN